MSFKKRKSSYRKAVTASVFDDYPIPQENEKIARIFTNRGGNVFEVELPSGEKYLALLPTKFNKLIWIKRGDYVIVSGSERQFTTSSGKQNGINSMIKHILRKEQIEHIKKENLWPEEWSQCEEPVAEKIAEEEKNSDSSSGSNSSDSSDNSNGSEDSESSDSDFSIEGNPNRRRFYVESDDSDDTD